MHPSKQEFYVLVTQKEGGDSLLLFKSTALAHTHDLKEKIALDITYSNEHLILQTGLFLSSIMYLTIVLTGLYSLTDSGIYLFSDSQDRIWNFFEPGLLACQEKERKQSAFFIHEGLAFPLPTFVYSDSVNFSKKKKKKGPPRQEDFITSIFRSAKKDNSQEILFCTQKTERKIQIATEEKRIHFVGIQWKESIHPLLLSNPLVDCLVEYLYLMK